ncbi:MAG TPA: TRAP transporter large permease subunit [Dehalococcoidales bacterium]|nr:TRAP transporter large permease subunit [Dehalococcoidales bacterium]
MSLGLMCVIILGTMVLLMVMGIEVAVSIGIAAGLGLLLFVDQPLNQFAFSAWGVLNSFTLTAVPLFVFMGAIFANTGTIEALFIGARKLFGFLPGGLISAVIGANAVFGAMSGSTIAAAATFGKIAFPEMERLGYNPRLVLGSMAVATTLSALIPPSIILIVYGDLRIVSVPRLFAGGIVPGAILASALILTTIVLVRINPSLTPGVVKTTWGEKLTALKQVTPFALVILLVLGSIFAGIMTPTESSSLGAFLSIVIALAYRRMSFLALKQSMLTAAKITAMIAFLLFTATVMSIVFHHIGLVEKFSELMLGLPFGKYGIFAVVCVAYLILGMFFDSISMMVLTFPVITPLINSLGFDPLWFGVVYVVLAEIGCVTPPFGLNLFALQSVVPKYDIMVIALGALPYLVPTLLLVVLLTAFPQLILWLPSLLY